MDSKSRKGIPLIFPILAAGVVVALAGKLISEPPAPTPDPAGR